MSYVPTTGPHSIARPCGIPIFLGVAQGRAVIARQKQGGLDLFAICWIFSSHVVWYQNVAKRSNPLTIRCGRKSLTLDTDYGTKIFVLAVDQYQTSHM